MVVVAGGSDAVKAITPNQAALGKFPARLVLVTSLADGNDRQRGVDFVSRTDLDTVLLSFAPALPKLSVSDGSASAHPFARLRASHSLPRRSLWPDCGRARGSGDGKCSLRACAVLVRAAGQGGGSGVPVLGAGRRGAVHHGGRPGQTARERRHRHEGRAGPSHRLAPVSVVTRKSTFSPTALALGRRTYCPQSSFCTVVTCCACGCNPGTLPTRRVKHEWL